MRSFRGNITLTKLWVKYQKWQELWLRWDTICLSKLYRQFITLWYIRTWHTAISFGQVLIQPGWNHYSGFRKKLLESWPLQNIIRNLDHYSYNFNCLTYNLPNYFANYFTLNKEMHGHNTRSASNIYINYRSTNYGKFSLKIRGAQIWNELPKELRISQSYNSFKKLTRDYIQNQV